MLITKAKLEANISLVKSYLDEQLPIYKYDKYKYKYENPPVFGGKICSVCYKWHLIDKLFLEIDYNDDIQKQFTDINSRLLEFVDSKDFKILGQKHYDTECSLWFKSLNIAGLTIGIALFAALFIVPLYCSFLNLLGVLITLGFVIFSIFMVGPIFYNIVEKIEAKLVSENLQDSSPYKELIQKIKNNSETEGDIDSSPRHVQPAVNSGASVVSAVVDPSSSLSINSPC